MCARSSSVHQKCFSYALTNLLFGLCRSVWVIELFVNLCNPNLGALTCHSTPKMLRNRECAPTPSTSIVFTFGFTIESIKKLRGASNNAVNEVGKFNPDSIVPFSWVDDSIINFYKLLFFSSLWFVCFLSTTIVVTNLDSVAFWNLISFFVEIVIACSVWLSRWSCNLLGFVVELLLPNLHVGCFVDFKITLYEGLFWRSALLLMAIIDFVTVSFLAIR